MHQTRNEVSMHIPITRKGTKYVARQNSHVDKSVSVVVAVRDMIKLARTAKEVHEMIKQKSLKLNGRIVYDYHDSIKPFNILEADKPYILSFTPNGRFVFNPHSSSERPSKVINKRLVGKNQIQLNLSDGTNLLSKEKINVHDTVYLDSQNKIKKHVAFEKGKNAFVIGGKATGKEGVIETVDGNTVKVKLKDSKEIHSLKKEKLMVI